MSNLPTRRRQTRRSSLHAIPRLIVVRLRASSRRPAAGPRRTPRRLVACSGDPVLRPGTAGSQGVLNSSKNSAAASRSRRCWRQRQSCEVSRTRTASEVCLTKVLVDQLAGKVQRRIGQMRERPARASAKSSRRARCRADPGVAVVGQRRSRRAEVVLEGDQARLIDIGSPGPAPQTLARCASWIGRQNRNGMPPRRWCVASDPPYL